MVAYTGQSGVPVLAPLLDELSGYIDPNVRPVESGPIDTSRGQAALRLQTLQAQESARRQAMGLGAARGGSSLGRVVAQRQAGSAQTQIARGAQEQMRQLQQAAIMQESQQQLQSRLAAQEWREKERMANAEGRGGALGSALTVLGAAAFASDARAKQDLQPMYSDVRAKEGVSGLPQWMEQYQAAQQPPEYVSSPETEALEQQLQSDSILDEGGLVAKGMEMVGLADTPMTQDVELEEERAPPRGAMAETMEASKQIAPTPYDQGYAAAQEWLQRRLQRRLGPPQEWLQRRLGPPQDNVGYTPSKQIAPTPYDQGYAAAQEWLQRRLGPPQDNVGPITPYQYRYTPKAAQRYGVDTAPRVGPVAQDLVARSPIYASAVQRGPDGMLAIDRDRALQAGIAADADLNARLRQLEGREAPTLMAQDMRGVVAPPGSHKEALASRLGTELAPESPNRISEAVLAERMRALGESRAAGLGAAPVRIRPVTDDLGLAMEYERMYGGR